MTSTGHTAGSACVGSQQLGNRSGRDQINGAMQWEALRKARWSAMRPGHLLAHTRRGHAAFVLMRLRSVRLRSGLRTRQMATRPRRHRCRGRSTSPAAGARLPGRTGHRLQPGRSWREMVAAGPTVSRGMCGMTTRPSTIQHTSTATRSAASASDKSRSNNDLLQRPRKTSGPGVRASRGLLLSSMPSARHSKRGITRWSVGQRGSPHPPPGGPRHHAPW